MRTGVLIILVVIVAGVAAGVGTVVLRERAMKADAGRPRWAADKVTRSLEEQLRPMKLRLGSPIYIRIFKESRELEMWVKGAARFELFRTYEVVALSGSLGPKLREGDHQGPEGFYAVAASQMNPNSKYHLAFNLGYPNTYDQVHGLTGSALMVHGDNVSDGCFAMTDAKIEEIYALADAALRGGQPSFCVHVFPFRMTDANMKRQAKSQWLDFWKNLKEGYDLFEASHVPPEAGVRDGRYVFNHE